jgi:superfamily II DNA or RNA helicase
MATLESLTAGTRVRGLIPDGEVTILAANWIGSNVIDVAYRDHAGRTGSQLVYRDHEASLSVEDAGEAWPFDADAALFKLAAEGRRIHLAHLFDPHLAVHTSLVDPLPHQITAVYQEMIVRQPLRFLLADDPGAGKTIMAGLLIKELRARGDVHRCMIVCPGSLGEQWQDELDKKFHLPFELATNDKLEASRTGNWFAENDLVICRLDKLSRNEDLQAKIAQTEWDLIVCDEAHKMSATYFGNEVKYTKRYRLGQKLSEVARHFLLMSATPHNGKEEDYQLFMALLDGDRFEGKQRDGARQVDASDMMRRLVKEQLVKFDGTPLFPERRAYSPGYKLSDAEADLYKQVTDYVKEEFNRAEALENEGRRGTVGFALTLLQRRLASSPAAAYESIRRRRERLEKRLREEKLDKRGAEIQRDFNTGLPTLADEDDVEDFEDAPVDELETREEEVLDQATAARTIAELETEILSLGRLEAMAQAVCRSGTDRKWDELSKILNERQEMFDASGNRRKLIIFTEHRDTLDYLQKKITGLLGKPEAIVVIHGGIGREERQKVQGAFRQSKDVEVMLATDAACEGINLQNAHLMVNYDLPWNPNRLEQRFGRIHRIGQTEVCHLWNLVADETREGDVYRRLLEKLETERKALGDKVFDVLGQVRFENRSLRDLLIEAIRYGERPEIKAKLFEVVDKGMDHDALRKLAEERALVGDILDATALARLRENMERAEAQRLQPTFVQSFFIAAFEHLGGTIHQREPGRFEITHVPGDIRARDRLIGRGNAVQPKYIRVTFEKKLVNVQGKPDAEFICPGHPLLDSVIDLVGERFGPLLKRGSILIDDFDAGEHVRGLVFLEHEIRDGRTNTKDQPVSVSRRMQFVSVDENGSPHMAGPAPYLDLRVPEKEELAALEKHGRPGWVRHYIEEQAVNYAAEQLVRPHYEEIKQRKQETIKRTRAAVRERLTSEVAYWDHRAQTLRQQELAGKTNARLNAAKANQRSDELAQRLKDRLAALDRELSLAPQAPTVTAAALVVPRGLVNRLLGRSEKPDTFAKETKEVEMLAMDAVMTSERSLGHAPRDVSLDKLGYDIESKDGKTGRLRFIEVKGRVADATTVTVTKNEVHTSLNKPDEFILAIVLVDGLNTTTQYIRKPFAKELDFHVSSVNYDLHDLLAMAKQPN